MQQGATIGKRCATAGRIGNASRASGDPASPTNRRGSAAPTLPRATHFPMRPTLAREGGGRRRGVSLVELMTALAVTAMVTAAVVGVAAAVHTSNHYAETMGELAQHARVTLERIDRIVAESAAAENNSAFVVIAANVGGAWFPDTLVVWHPAGNPTFPPGPALVSELVIFCPDPVTPSQLVEITAPADVRPVVLDDLDTPGGQALIEGVKQSATSRKVVLTDRLRTASAGGTLRGAVRFERRLRPSEGDWADFRGGTLAWEALDWPQGIYGENAGMRQAWLRVELQLVPGGSDGTQGDWTSEPVPFFGSAARYFELKR